MKNEKVIALSELKDNPFNTRLHPQKQIEEFAKSVKKYGQVRPIVIDENNVILVGHGLKLAMQEIGLTEADCLVMEGLSEDEKKKLLLSDNKIFSLGVDNYDAIDRLISELSDFDIPGYNAEDLEKMYGQSSIAESENEFKLSEQIIAERKEKAKEFEEPESTNHVPAYVETARQEVAQAEAERKFVVCPNCGEKVYVD